MNDLSSYFYFENYISVLTLFALNPVFEYRAEKLKYIHLRPCELFTHYLPLCCKLHTTEKWLFIIYLRIYNLMSLCCVPRLWGVATKELSKGCVLHYMNIFRVLVSEIPRPQGWPYRLHVFNSNWYILVQTAYMLVKGARIKKKKKLSK